MSGYAAMGPALLLICFLALAVVVGVCVLAYAARCLLVVVEATAAGADQVHWPDEGFVDWIGRSLALMGLSLILLVPAGILMTVVGLRSVFLAGLVLWLLFPVGALSSFSAESRWVFFQPVIATRMLRLLPATLLFYLTSGAVVAAATGPWYFAVAGQRLLLLLVAAPLGAAMVLIYARLLGRLAWKLGQLGPLPSGPLTGRRKRRRLTASDPGLVPSHISLPVPTKSFEPWPEPGSHIPQSPTGLLEPENLVPYELGDEQRAALAKHEAEKPPERLRPLDPEEEQAKIPYEMAEPPSRNPSVSAETYLSTLPRSLQQEPSRQGDATLSSSFGAVLAFPLQATCRGALAYLSLGALVWGWLVMEVVSLVSYLG